jgi:HAD superfamily hydrolase (TIGR01484 family)
MKRWKPWRQAPSDMLSHCVGVLTDIDDTLTKDGAIEPEALQALHDARDAGLPVVAITGRPLGWSLPFASAWPVLAIVAENGAVSARRSGKDEGKESAQAEGLLVEYVQDETTRQHNSARLKSVAAEVLHQLPHARLASDSAGRVTDIAVDHSEHAHLSEDDIAKVVAIMKAAGMQATVSSIHVNGWFGSHSKWSGACWIVERLLSRSLPDEASRWIYVGDSTNDQVMFERLPNAVGVANLMRFESQITRWPRYLTEHERGRGFAEVISRVLAEKARGAGR